ncbi:MAG: polysaccharide biosynthesis C-terminal domain-containing protein [Flavobacteriales bacterium]|nr:polysaccharide biosynthesis C-terminal domain-containing protein [Flavobacteriales bacterium]
MIGNIINTVSTRIALAALAIVLLLLNSNFLGSEGLGIVGILVLEVAIYLLISNLICGGSLIYFASKKKQNELLISSYTWILITASLFFFVTSYVPYLQSDFAKDVFFLGLLQSGVGTHINLLAGKQKIKQFNSITLLQVVVQMGSLCVFYFLLDQANVQAFINSTYLGYGLAFVVSFIRLIPQLEKNISLPHFSLFKELIQYGFYLQIANVTQLLNYRLSYLLLNHYSGVSAVGTFMPGVQLSEGVLLPSKSIGIVQYAKISRLKSRKQAALLSVKLLKITILLSLPLILILILIPSSIYASVLKEDFRNTPQIIALMGIGVLALAGEIILSRYFSGTGQQKVNASSSSLGLLVTVVAGFSLIPSFGMWGAAITASCSFVSIFVFLLYRMIRSTDLQLRDFWFRKEDVVFLKRLIRLVRRKG